MAVDNAQLAQPQRQIPVRAGLRLIHQHAAGTVHGFDGIVLLVDDCGVHIVFIVIPVARGFPETPVQNDGRGDLLIAVSLMELVPVIQQSVFKDHSLGQKEGKSRSRLVHHEQSQLFAQLPVISLLGLFHHGQILVQLCLLGEGGTVDPGQHFVMLVPSPIGARQAGKLKGLYRLGTHQMRSGAEIDKLSLLIEADLRPLRQIFDQFHFIGLLTLFHKGDGFLSGFCETGDFQILFDNLLHLPFQLLQVFRGKSSLDVNIIVKSVSNGGADGQFCLGIQALNRLSQDVGGGMPVGCQSLRIGSSQDAQAAVPVYPMPQIHHLTVHLAGSGSSGKALADVFRNLQHRHGGAVFLSAAVFQCNNHDLLLLFHIFGEQKSLTAFLP